MRSIFRKKIKESSPGQENKISAGVRNFTHQIKTNWAGYMAKGTAGLSKRSLILTLITFVLLTGGLSAYTVLKSLVAKPAAMLSITKIEAPNSGSGKSGIDLSKALSMSEQEYQRVTQFRHYMDSLAQSELGQITRDSILKKHPGLMDSVRYIENYFKSQFKTK